MLKKIEEAAQYLLSETSNFKPEFGIILGTGLSGLVKEIDIKYEFTYSDIPYFEIPTVEFHSGKLIFGNLSGKPVICMSGRFHFYEGYDMNQVTFPVRVMKLLGVHSLIVSNAAGGLKQDFMESDIMVIEDHISLFLPTSPLVGANILGERFPDMSEPYDAAYISLIERIAHENNFSILKKGAYVSVTGPQLETKAEYRMLRLLGADAVGMSTVPEVIVARQMELKVLALSVITDLCVPELLKAVDLNKIIAAANVAEPYLITLIKTFLQRV